MSDYEEVKYVGFWIRVLATIADTIWMLIFIGIIGALTLGPAAAESLFLNLVLPAGLVIAFWAWKSATPGKMIVSAKIVDATTGNKPSLGQFIVRYIGYFPAYLVLGLGVIWVAFEPRKRGWHDMMAGTMVIRE